MLCTWIRYAGLMVAMGWLAGTATAKPLLTFTDLVDPTPDILLDTRTLTHRYTHSILDDGFDPLRHTLGTINLTLDVRDDALLDKRERVAVSLDGLGQGAFVVSGADLVFTVDVALVAQDGLLQVALTRDKGDFFFRQSTLVAAQTPEPATLLLLGSGLVAVVGVRRRWPGRGSRTPERA
jgi:hypothetical protein